ncbi:MAG: hypothetical protein COV31_01015 [Candidatus Yanofskybacteria bacterium CG10_big_fil_rev_8_21_14_0_10_46_23]|uniref:Uncharacterized protein n=1 Tax=Candidatus Yanofskybacteria bacterium CG10_big_fil_rev_8_21_14_0_10_46_23 TaxID=1975098 RepID=A0A2H0R4I3_9BACT|nr:MAG: hypothetical protein COV31_01015 [Candidatus Yanofskybacteria bacterium CG10_big_fil_rev_8_21_14_0_10_46_23]
MPSVFLILFLGIITLLICFLTLAGVFLLGYCLAKVAWVLFLKNDAEFKDVAEFFVISLFGGLILALGSFLSFLVHLFSLIATLAANS